MIVFVNSAFPGKVSAFRNENAYNLKVLHNIKYSYLFHSVAIAEVKQ